MKTLKTAAAAGCFLVSVLPAVAHVEFEAAEAKAGTPVRLVLVVGHGCDGAATTGVRVQIPGTVFAVTPEAPAGWEADTVTGAYPAPVTIGGETLTRGVTQIIWRGGPLPAHDHGAFAFTATLGDSIAPGASVTFPVVQECGGVVVRWIEVPQLGGAGDALQRPAPTITVLPAN